jgi:hypothetical protein
MNITEVLQRLKSHRIDVGRDTLQPDGTRIIIVGCALPEFPFGKNRFRYYTLTLSPGQTDVALEEREAMRRRLYHATTDIFGDDAAEWPDLVENGTNQE